MLDASKSGKKRSFAHDPLVNSYITIWKDPPFLMGKLTISTGPWLPVRFLYVKTRPGIYHMETDGKNQQRMRLRRDCRRR